MLSTNRNTKSERDQDQRKQNAQLFVGVDCLAIRLLKHPID